VELTVGSQGAGYPISSMLEKDKLDLEQANTSIKRLNSKNVVELCKYLVARKLEIPDTLK